MNLPLLAAIDTNHLQTQLSPLLLLLIPVIIALAIWDGVWKLIALWKSARNDQLAWFICLAIFNTIGILPILYILFFQKKAAPPVQAGM
jgi:predicted permease